MADKTLVSTDELSSLFLFEGLDTGKLNWLADHGSERRVPAGDTIYVEGDNADCLFILLDGTITLSRQVRGSGDVEVNRTDHHGSYFGAVWSLIEPGERAGYTNTAHAITDCRLFTLPVAGFGAAVREWFPMGIHLVRGIFGTMQESNARVAERQRLVSLGAVTAGLTHELNNPAAAALRAADELHTSIGKMRAQLGRLADLSVGLEELVRLQAATVERINPPSDASPLTISDREDELADWLEDHDGDRLLADTSEVASTFVAAGLDSAWADEVAGSVDPAGLPATIAWLASTVETEALLTEMGEATKRIGNLIAMAKQYSQMDRAPLQSVDVHELLNSTLLIFKYKLKKKGIALVKDYDSSIGPVEVYAAELNQVWVNLIHNALDAMVGSGAPGTLTIRTKADGDRVLVEFGDTGPGVPEDVRSRLFEPFFTTKPVGEGTGLGLDISWRIVVNKHHGDLNVVSEPGDTRFQVWLPRRQSV